MKITNLAVSSALTMAGISAAWATAPNLAATPVVVAAKAEQAGEVRDGALAAHRHAHPGKQAHGHERMGRHGGPGMMPPPPMAALDLFGVGPFDVRPMHEGPPPPPKAEGGKLSAQDAAQKVKGDEAEMQNRARWAERRLARRIDQVVESVKGTPEQAEKISKLASAAFQELRPLHEQMRALDQRAEALYQAETLDRAEFEALRTERSKLMDQISQRSMNAWLDMASVLTPEQRKQLAERAMHPPRLAHGMHGGHGHRPPMQGHAQGMNGQGPDMPPPAMEAPEGAPGETGQPQPQAAQ